MAKLKDFYKIVPGGSMARKGGPVSPGAPGEAGASALYQNFSWYAAAIRGVNTRFQKYRIYNQMDKDADVSRSLDTIADEMTPRGDDNMELQFEIKFNIPESEEADEIVVVTLRHELQRFCRQHRLDIRLWNICRQTAKYGDCFFQKVKDRNGKTIWRYLDQTTILGILLDQNTRKPVYYQIKLEKTDPEYRGNTKKDTIFIPATKVIHFSFGSEMNNTAPFGESVLQKIYRVWRQLELLEDAVIIYRVVRAPERRVFYIDVGKMSPIKSKQYLDRIRTEIKQKRIPSAEGGTNKMDTVYNAASMQEDFYIAQTADGRGSKIETLPGGQNLGELDDLYFFQEKLFRGMRIPVSYMVNTRGEQGANTNDGKVGTAYIAELRFVRFVMRLQEFIDNTFDIEFKEFLKSDGINVDESTFELKLPEPENFGIYRTSELAGQLFGNFSNARDIPYMSPRFALRQFMNFNDDDLQLMEMLWKQERGITGPRFVPIKDPVTGDNTGQFKEISEIQLMYDPKYLEDDI